MLHGGEPSTGELHLLMMIGCSLDATQRSGPRAALRSVRAENPPARQGSHAPLVLSCCLIANFLICIDPIILEI